MADIQTELIAKRQAISVGNRGGDWNGVETLKLTGDEMWAFVGTKVNKKPPPPRGDEGSTV
jgi:hypothetical protein